MMSLEDAIIHCKARAKADCSECAKEHQQLSEWLEELKSYKNLKKQGKLPKLPCAVGDTVYEVDKAILYDENIEPIECKVEHITVFKTNIYFSVTVIKGHGSGCTYEFELKDFGKTVFLTREEAEAALKALES